MTSQSFKNKILVTKSKQAPLCETRLFLSFTYYLFTSYPFIISLKNTVLESQKKNFILFYFFFLTFIFIFFSIYFLFWELGLGFSMTSHDQMS